MTPRDPATPIAASKGMAAALKSPTGRDAGARTSLKKPLQASSLEALFSELIMDDNGDGSVPVAAFPAPIDMSGSLNLDKINIQSRFRRKEEDIGASSLSNASASISLRSKRGKPRTANRQSAPFATLSERQETNTLQRISSALLKESPRGAERLGDSSSSTAPARRLSMELSRTHTQQTAQELSGESLAPLSMESGEKPLAAEEKESPLAIQSSKENPPRPPASLGSDTSQKVRAQTPGSTSSAPAGIAVAQPAQRVQQKNDAIRQALAEEDIKSNEHEVMFHELKESVNAELECLLRFHNPVMDSLQRVAVLKGN